MTETRAHGNSPGSAQQGLYNEYQHDMIKMVFKNRCVPVLFTKLASALEGFKYNKTIMMQDLSRRHVCVSEEVTVWINTRCKM